MGFLDNTTNNIILDAVLTDTGRQFLARNDGSFSLFKFGLGDDEVNYGIITKYGRTVGKEKIVKNTPVFEALTDPGAALRSSLVSLSNPNLIYIPTLTLSATSNPVTLSINNNNLRSAIVTVTQNNGNNPNAIDVELQDVNFDVSMNNLFLQIFGGANNLVMIDNQQRAMYRLPADTARLSSGGTQLTFQITPKALTTQVFSIYGVNNSITTYITIKGVLSGASIDVPVTINLN